MLGKSRQKLTRGLQKIFWVYLTNNFVISSPSDVTVRRDDGGLRLIAMTPENCGMAENFRSRDRVAEYQAKLARNEIGYFAETDGKAVGSIWATLNRGQTPSVARAYMPLMPSEAMIHDIVTGEHFRGRGVGPFMVSAFADVLFRQYGTVRIIVDVNAKNHPSLRMMEKAGLRAKEQVLYISAFGTLLTHRVLKEF